MKNLELNKALDLHERRAAKAPTRYLVVYCEYVG